jgi:hypothetical protein
MQEVLENDGRRQPLQGHAVVIGRVINNGIGIIRLLESAFA